MEISHAAKAHLAKVRNYVPGKPLEELEREYGIRNAVKMASNENPLGPSPKALAAIRKKAPLVNRYPDGGCFYLRQKLAKYLKTDPENIVFGNGSDELLVMAARAFVGPADEVIIAEPTFLIYSIATQAENGTAIKVPMKNYRYDLEAMRQKINWRTKLIFIANPDNPVGTYVNEKELLNFLKAVPKQVIIVLDEAYFEFAAIKKDYPDSMKLLPAFDNLIVTRTFSKAYGLSGMRIGYGAMHPKIAATLNKVREPFNVNLLAQAAAEAALDDKAYLKKTLTLTNEGRRYLVKELRGLGAFCIDTATNFVLADIKTDAQNVYEKLLKQGVIVRSMAAWGMKNFIRVTIGRPEENKRFIKTIKKILKSNP